MAAEFRAHELLLRAHDTLASGDLIKRPFQSSLIACDERDVTPLQRDIAEWLRRCEAEPGQVLIEFVTEILTGPDATSDAERIAGLVTALKAIDAAIENVLGLPIAPAAAKDRTETQATIQQLGSARASQMGRSQTLAARAANQSRPCSTRHRTYWTAPKIHWRNNEQRKGSVCGGRWLGRDDPVGDLPDDGKGWGASGDGGGAGGGSAPTIAGRAAKNAAKYPKAQDRGCGVGGGESTTSPGEDGTARGTLGLAILQALRHGDLTSIQTFESVTKAGLKTTSGSVYQTLRVLAGKGRIKKTQNDEGVTSWARVE